MRRREFDKNSIPKPPLPPPGWLMSSSALKELEIGAGDGEFAFHRAKSRPDIHFIAIEKSRTLFHRMQRQYQKQKLSNLWIFHTNAVWWITHFVPKNWLDRVYILYPNTYIKARQKNLRWCNRPFMAYLLERIKTGGTLEIRTNQKKYYEETKQKMRSYTNIKESQDLQFIPSQPASPPTHNRSSWLKSFVARHKIWIDRTWSQPASPPTRGAFERKYRACGETNWSLVYTKLANPS